MVEINVVRLYLNTVLTPHAGNAEWEVIGWRKEKCNNGEQDKNVWGKDLKKKVF